MYSYSGLRYYIFSNFAKKTDAVGLKRHGKIRSCSHRSRSGSSNNCRANFSYDNIDQIVGFKFSDEGFYPFTGKFVGLPLIKKGPGQFGGFQ